MIKVFISHTSSDHPFVEWLKTRLERENLGFDIFIDDGSVFVGDDPQKMIDEVKKSIIFLPVLSNESIQKEFIQNEIKTAFSNSTTYVFPIKLKCDDANIPEEFRTKFIACDKVEGKIYEDFSDEQEWDMRYENLRRAIFNKIVELGLFKEDTQDYYQDCEHLDLILQRDAPTILEIKTVIDVYLKKEAYQRYFFGKLTNIRWLKYLKLYGYLRSNPQPIEDVDSPGLFKIPQWNALVYLERVSSQAGISDEVINDLLDIITSVTGLKNPSGQHIDNYRTWYYFAKILVNLPTEKIPAEIINLISVWLKSKFKTSLPGAEIAEKLLPRFLNSDKSEDWEKAERIIEIITEITWIPLPESQRSIRERNIEARTIIEPHWLKRGFDKSIERIGTVCSIRVIERLAKKLLSIFSRQYNDGYDVDYEGKKYQIAHTFLEDGRHQISVHLLNYPQDWDGVSRSKIEKTSVTSFTLSDFENSADFLTKVKEGLIKNGFSSLTTELDEPISSIYTLHDYTYIGYNSLYVSPEHINIDDTDKILIYLLKEILAVKAKLDKQETSKVLDKLLSREYPYPFFKRLILFVAGGEWDKYKEYFVKIIELEEMKCFEDSDFAMELSILLKNNVSKFSSAEKGKIRAVIEKGPQQVPEENPVKYTAYWKQKWLSLLKDDPLFATLFEEQKKVTGIEKDQFSYGYEFKRSSGFGPSPLSTEEILSLPGTELAIKLKEFRSEKKWDGQTVVAFSNALKDAVLARPNDFIENLHFFKDIGFVYIYKLLDGLLDSWKDKKTIDWGKIFEFIVSYITKDQFWKDEYIVEPGTWLGGSDHKLVIAIIADLIQEGTKDDSWAFPKEYFTKAKEIIFTLLRDTESDKEITDYVFHVLNSPCGKLITALVFLALRIARVNAKKGVKSVPQWTDEYRFKFDELLDKNIIDAYTSLGRFLPYLLYLDKNWVKDKIRSLASDTGSQHWVAFMEGYLSIGNVYDELYKPMKPHYQYGLSYEFRERNDRENLIRHICIGYLRGHEAFKEPASLFRMIVDDWKSDQIKEVIAFFWMQRDYLKISAEENVGMKEKIIEFWRQLYENYNGKDESSLTKEDNQILSAASKLASLLSQIDTESYEWLLLSAPYVHEDYNSSFFIESLDELKDKGDRNETPNYIGDVYLKMLEKITPDFDQKHILSIVEFLYSAGAIDSANKICNIYGARGHEFLRDIYEKHNKKP